MSRKLWTGKTVRQELVCFVVSAMTVKGFDVFEALSHVFDGAEHCPPSSIKASVARWWDSDTTTGNQRRLVELECRRKARDYRRMMGS